MLFTCVHRALLIEHRARFIEYRALLMVYRAFSRIYRAFWIECRALFWYISDPILFLPGLTAVHVCTQGSFDRIQGSFDRI